MGKKTRSRAAACVLLAGGVALPACGGGGETPVATTPASPVPAPAPTPAPTPTPTPVPGSTCALGNGDPTARCAVASPSFLVQVDTAINQLIQQKPAIFNLSEDVGNGNYRVLSSGQYYLGVMANLEKMGLCAGFDGEELQVKDSNDSSDQYHILLSSGHIRRGPSIYRVTCFPAAFPEPRTAPGQVAGCPLPGSREVACSRENQHYLADVEAAIVELARDRPELFNLGDNQPGTDFFKVVNVDAYLSAMVATMIKRGYCANFDGEELVVKKVNDFTDHFDILTGDNYIRRGAGSYRATCYPAAF